MNRVKAIVVVDDEPVQLDAVSRILIERGFRVNSFSRADQALEHIHFNQPDLVLSDLRLHSLGGIEFIKRIKTFNQDIECILMTGHSSVDSAVDALRLGVRDYLFKPFKSAELLAVVDRVLYVKALKEDNRLLRQELYSRLPDNNISSSLDEQSRMFLTRIHSTSDRGTSLVSDLLASARLGEQSLSVKELDLGQLVERVRVFAQLEARQGEIEWRIGSLPIVRADESLLEQVFSDLFSNSIKYTCHVLNPVIELQCRECVDYFHFTVKDNGAGFDPDIYEGNGLGLVNVKRIVEKHGGEISAKSRLGEGSEFDFSLSKKLAENDPDARPEPEMPGRDSADSVGLVNGAITNLMQVSAGSFKADNLVNELIAQFVHKLNNAMLPYVLELDDHLDKIDQFSAVDQLKLRAFDAEIRALISAIRQVRSIIGKKTPSQFG